VAYLLQATRTVASRLKFLKKSAVGTILTIFFLVLV
jgi:hypothetical protein